LNLETAVGVFEVERIVHFHGHDARSQRGSSRWFRFTNI
jgi:hypothetical protein